MVNVTTYNIYVSGQLPNPQLSGDIDPVTHKITIGAYGSAMMGISVASLTDESGQPVTFSDPPIAFLPLGAPQPQFVSWARLSPTYLLVTNLNWNQEMVPFSMLVSGGVFSPEAGVVELGIDPTIVNTYIPPPTPMVSLVPVIPGRPAAPAHPEGPPPQQACDEAGAERRIA